MSNEWKANDHTAECASWNSVTKGGHYDGPLHAPTLRLERLPCNCRLAQPKPAACELPDLVWRCWCGHGIRGTQSDFLAHIDAQHKERTPPEPLARDTTVREHMRFEAAKAAMQGLLANPAHEGTTNAWVINSSVNFADSLLAALEVQRDA